MHYGHPDVFDRVFHITRGGISKASRVINISEDIFSGMAACFLYKLGLDSLRLFHLDSCYFTGFNSTLRQGNITHHEYIQASVLLIQCFYDKYYSNNEVYRLAREGTLGSIRLHYLKEKLPGVMVNKFSVEMYTDLGNFLISSG